MSNYDSLAEGLFEKGDAERERRKQPTPLELLIGYIEESTVVYRKGDVVKYEPQGSHVDVVTIDAFPQRPEGVDVVDCHFVEVAIRPRAKEISKEAFYDMAIATSKGIFREMTPERWRAGPSYIEIGGWLGDQTMAFRFMALVQIHELGEVITPAAFGLTGEKANEFAGAGYILISGLKNPRSDT